MLLADDRWFGCSQGVVGETLEGTIPEGAKANGGEGTEKKAITLAEIPYEVVVGGR